MLDLQALFKLSYAMCILSSKKGDMLNGCIVNTVFQVVPEPPMVAVSLNNESLTHQYIAGSRVFAASILSQTAPKFMIGAFGFKSGRDTDRFENVAYRIGRTGTRRAG